ncbi:MAG TPA: UDP-glucuronic acid decarboxylase family protein [Gammaproteobacteria bacterium]|nr:UDP-glucuronic acid decarboxylase family protein [Gammaproteobacteria bacterium]
MRVVSSKAKDGPSADARPLTILVAGAAGFIGSHLVDRLLDDGHRVIGIDNFITGRPANLSHLSDEPRFRFVEQDITKPLRIKTKLDWVMHFASPASPPKYLRWPLETLLANSVGTHHLLELARRNGAQFLLASTSEVYGDALEHPQTELYWGNVNPIGPRSVYDEGKRYAEAMTMSYNREHHLPVRVVRIFNTYGARMDPYDGRVVTNFVRQALTNEPLTVYGDGSQTRSLQHVSDLVEAVVRLMQVDYPRPLNIGNPKEYSVLEIARMVLKQFHSDSPIMFEPLPTDDPTRRRPDISRAIELLGWEPRVQAVDGLADVAASLTSALSARQRKGGAAAGLRGARAPSRS